MQSKNTLAIAIFHYFLSAKNLGPILGKTTSAKYGYTYLNQKLDTGPLIKKHNANILYSLLKLNPFYS